MSRLADLALALSPPRLRNRVGQKLVYALVALLDVILEWLYQGVSARFPLVGTPSALGAIGRDRVIRRGTSESDAGYALRLASWLDDWRLAGTAYALLHQIAGFLGPAAPRLRLVSSAAGVAIWYTLEPDGRFTVAKASPSNWDWDSATNPIASTLWARFFVVIYSDTGNPWHEAGLWAGGSTWGGGQLWGFTATPAQIADIKAILSDWRSAHSVCPWVIVAFDPAGFSPSGSGAGYPDGYWGHWHRIAAGGGVAVPSRNTTARYFEVT